MICKGGLFDDNFEIAFSTLHKNTHCGYSLEVPCKLILFQRIKKITRELSLTGPLLSGNALQKKADQKTDSVLEWVSGKYVSYFSTKTYVVGTH